MSLSQSELTKFGITPEDERPHPFSPDHEAWNESYFFDWIDRSGEPAGHLRVGWHPNQDRWWLWFMLWNGSEWAVVEQPRLPLSSLRIPDLVYEGWGLSFSYEVGEPLRSGRLRCSGFARVVSGRRSGFVLPASVDLDVAAVGAAHSGGPSEVPGHSAGGYEANRFEQPITVTGTGRLGDDSFALDGRGERDHSWGPRDWNLEWLFVVLHGDYLRMQWARAEVPGVGIFTVGYLHRRDSVAITEVEDDIAFDDDDVLHPAAGTFRATAEDGTVVSGRLASVTGTEVDITHAFTPPRPTVYRRALVRFTPDDGSPPTTGWLESNRFARGSG